MRAVVCTVLLVSLALLLLLGPAAGFDLTMGDQYSFAEYLRDFPEKQYAADAGELAMREAVFEKRLAKIKHHNTHLAGKTKGYRKVEKEGFAWWWWWWSCC